MPDYTKEIEKRRTLPSSPSGCRESSLTEKFLLYGGAINLAGSVKGKATARHTVSDWMEIEKERGISVPLVYCSLIMTDAALIPWILPVIRISPKIYRTLMAADSAVMVIDASKGVEAQTRKLFKVCAMRHIPVFTFINKLDGTPTIPLSFWMILKMSWGFPPVR